MKSEILQKLKVTGLTVMAVVGIASGCASNPDEVEAAYVSSLKYKDYDCDQLAMEMDQVGQRTTELYHRLKKEKPTTGKWGLVWFSSGRRFSFWKAGMVQRQPSTLNLRETLKRCGPTPWKESAELKHRRPKKY